MSDPTAFVPQPPAGVLLIVLALVFGCAPASYGSDDPGREAGVVAFVGVNVVPMNVEQVLRGQTVVVRSGRIVEIGPAAEVQLPVGASVIEGQDRYLLPGLAEMHSHLATMHNGQASPQLVEQLLLLYLLNGVTTIRGMATHPNHLAIRDGVRSGEILGPRIYVAAPSLNANNARDPVVAAELVRERAAAGYDLLKIHGGFGRAAFDAIMEAAREVGITVGGHIDQEAGLEHTLASRQSTIEHLDGFIQAVVAPEVHERVQRGEITWVEAHAYVDADRVRAIAEAFRRNGVWSVPTAYFSEAMAAMLSGEAVAALHPELDYMPQGIRDGWIEQVDTWHTTMANAGATPESRHLRAQVRRQFLKALSDAGAPILLGVDSPFPMMVPGFSVHREMAVMAGAGLTPYQVLKTGTRNVGRYVTEELGQDGEFGTIEVGKWADLVLLQANPLTDVANARNPIGVMVRGRWLPADELEQRIKANAEALARETAR